MGGRFSPVPDLAPLLPLVQPGNVWSMGPFGAMLGIFPTGGALRGDALFAEAPGVRLRLGGLPQPVAFEALSSDPLGWNHGIALCLPAAEPAGPEVLDWAGADHGALDPGDRARQVLDLGLRASQGRILLRLAPEAAAPFLGRPFAEVRPALADLPAVWIAETALGRIEQVHHPRPGAGAPLMFMPKMLGSGRTHAATTPVPEGLVPLSHVFPRHPARQAPGVSKAFDAAAHAAFQDLLARYGIPEFWALKQSVLAALRRGELLDIAGGRHRMAALRVALRQARHVMPGADLQPWLERYDAPMLAAMEAGR